MRETIIDNLIMVAAVLTALAIVTVLLIACVTPFAAAVLFLRWLGIA